MNSTLEGMWEEKTPSGTTILFNTKHDPQRITVLKPTGNLVHFDCIDGITVEDIVRVRNFAK